ncbi:hypothetical protein [Ferribacterium limneticum]|uniref:hypothetical protein n=1 Tax=Ferribacterium limneticum TaxID=76259 RepID=UPI001CF90E84|nr:hypothetical protein [Ferribacterium limneticum]UCV23683.1 hypothetical protein KI613_03850 [Ferribacterium limneticum]
MRDTASGGDGVAASESKVIAISADDLFDQSKVTQTFQVACDAGDRQVRQERFSIENAELSTLLQVDEALVARDDKVISHHCRDYGRSRSGNAQRSEARIWSFRAGIKGYCKSGAGRVSGRKSYGEAPDINQPWFNARIFLLYF